MNWTPTDREPYLPTPSEIEQACQEIRAGWDLSEHRKRAGYSPTAFDVTTPLVKAGEMYLDDEEIPRSL